MRAVALAICVAAGGSPACADIVAARFAEPTDRYDHGILGDAVEWGALVIETRTGGTVTIRQPDAHVFEDIAPRLWDVDGDGAPEVVVVDTSVILGARLAVYDETGLVAATPHIGQTHRWLAPLAAADLDGDGLTEIAYIDRPHLDRTLRIVRLSGDTLTEVAALSGLTNHRIGDSHIGGGLRDCGTGPEIIAANGNWDRVIAVTFADGTLTAQDVGPYSDTGSFAAALACR